MQIIHDINCLATVVSGDYLTHVLQLLSSCSSEVLDLVKQSILDGGRSLSTLLPIAIKTIVDALVEKAVEVRLTLYRILHQFIMQWFEGCLVLCSFDFCIVKLL